MTAADKDPVAAAEDERLVDAEKDWERGKLRDAADDAEAVADMSLVCGAASEQGSCVSSSTSSATTNRITAGRCWSTKGKPADAVPFGRRNGTETKHCGDRW